MGYPLRDSIKLLFVSIVGLAVLLPFASGYPDGLETVVQSVGLEEPNAFWHGLMPDYSLSTIEDPYFSTLASGLVGILLVLAFAFLFGTVATRRAQSIDSQI